MHLRLRHFRSLIRDTSFGNPERNLIVHKQIASRVENVIILVPLVTSSQEEVSYMDNKTGKCVPKELLLAVGYCDLSAEV